MVLAHRLSWELSRGQIPPDLFVLHKNLCNNPKCVNPDHLYLGSAGDNMRDTIAAGHHKRHGCKGEFNGKAKLSPADVFFIRNMLASGMRGADLARQFGVTCTSICDIAKRKTWRHI